MAMQYIAYILVFIYIGVIQIIRLWRIHNVKKTYRANPFKVMRQLFYKEFPFSNDCGSLMSTFLTFAVPEIADKLAETSKFIKTPEVRHADTIKLMRQCMVNDIESEEWRNTLTRLKSIHRNITVDNKYYLYTLAVFAIEPFKFVEKYDYRVPIEEEKHAVYECWKRVGEAMGIKEIPETYLDMEIFKTQFERDNFRFTANAALLTQTSIDFLGKMVPRAVASSFLGAIFDSRTCNALGIQPNPVLSKIVLLVLYVRRIFVSLFGFPRLRYTAVELN